MRFSTQVRYAVRAMIDLGHHAKESVVSRTDIARRQAISADYLAQICHALMNADLIKSIRGPGGGYSLTRPLAEITAGEIVRAIEGEIKVVDCQAKHNHPTLAVENCAAAWLWQMVSQSVNATLDAVTLEMLCQRSDEGEDGP